MAALRSRRASAGAWLPVRRSRGGWTSCLGLFPQDEWDDLAGKLRSLPLTNPRAREFARFMSSGAVDVELDRQGRVLVPSYLREYAGDRGRRGRRRCAEPAGALGAGSAWQPYRAKIEDEPEALAEHLADLGI